MQLAIDILAKLGLDTIKLEAEGNGHYIYCAWNRPLVEHNGPVKTIKRGRLRISPVSLLWPMRSAAVS
jgi:hypothetical protein